VLNSGTVIRLGTVDLGKVSFSLPLYMGATPRQTVVRCAGHLYGDLAALPRVVDLSVTTSEEDASAQPRHATTTLRNLRLLEVRQIDDRTCEVLLGDCRAELSRLVCPADFNLYWRDGYLNETNHRTFAGALAYMSDMVPALSECLQAVSLPDESLPDELPLSGMALTRALDLLADAAGLAVTVDADGLLTFVRRGEAVDIVTAAWNWATAHRPSWELAGRTRKGLPKIIRFFYPEKHALKLTPVDERSTATPSALRIEFEQVYAYGEQFLPLAELLAAFGLPSDAITADQVTIKINTENFEGTAVAPENEFDTSTQELIQILKRDHDSLFRITYPDAIGRVGGWTDIHFGTFATITDKDGDTRVTDDVVGRSVRCDWTEYLAKAESQQPDQSTLEWAVVVRSHKADAGQDPPEAPWSAAWVNEEAGVFRVSPSPREATAQAMWLRSLTDGQDTLLVSIEEASVDDQGNPVGNIAGLHFPTVSDVVLSTTLNLEVYAVATRRLPNNYKRWTAVDIEGFPEGDVDVMHIEVADNLYAIRGHEGTLADGLGEYKNMDVLIDDASRRARVVREAFAARAAGEGSILGAQAIRELHVGGAVQELTLDVDGVVVMTTVRVGPSDNEAARQQRVMRRAASRRVALGGKVAVV
jgi:hypothetical protein